ncbi:coproporphyrinogen III oxidase [Sulfurimonas sp.]|uniref:coproporphyrinogen III oxidase n=1 Tax=Sulfurimonas sp. TaxID=2022749 RepID=UPI0039E66A1E
MMEKAQSLQAIEAYELVTQLQTYFADRLNKVSAEFGSAQDFEEVFWVRDEGKHGGGSRLEARDETLFNRGSVNVSQIQYDDMPEKKLGSATAISTIIHPNNPHVPSMHMHISWTEMRDGKGYWRVMADLNPSIVNEEAKGVFTATLKSEAAEHAASGIASGNKYFNIPALGRTRGVSHFYLEGFNTGDFQADKAFAKNMGTKVIDAYIKIITNAMQKNPTFTKEEKAEQLAYHTLYLFQVLTLDRGTTSGLLVHSQNDVGIMGSIPSHVNRELLTSWIDKMPAPQEKLVQALLDALPHEMPTPVEVDTKKKLAQAVRGHYKQYPEALSMQASGEIIPPTVDNHS